MAKIRVHDLAKQMGITSKDLIFMLQSIGVDVISHTSTIDDEIISAILEGKEMATPNKVIIRDSKEVKPKVPRPDLKKQKEGLPEVAIKAEPAKLGVRPPLAAKLAAAPGVPPATPSAAPAPSHQESKLGTVPHGAAAASSAPPAPASAPSAPERPAASAESHVAPPAPPPAAPPSVSIRAGAHPAVRPPGTPLGRVEGGRALPVQRPTTGRPVPGGVRASVSGSARPSSLGRPASPAGRTTSGAPGSRPLGARPGGPPRPGSRPERPEAPATTEAERRVRAPKKEPSAEEIERDKKAAAKKGTKKPKVVAAQEVEVRDFLGEFEEDTYEDIEEIQMEVEKGPPVGARRKGEAKSSIKPQERVSTRGKLLEFKKPQPTGQVYITEAITVRELADRLGILVKDLMKSLFEKGILANINQVIDPNLAVQLAAGFGMEAKIVSFEEQVGLEAEPETAEDVEKPAGRTGRAPVVTVMGHVDHGKTSLLDAIRKSEVAAGEAGGITQHIGAYHVDIDNRRIVFLDTPGHEAFTLMRARGAKATDIVVLVVAADDGVMPQTIEAINHARAANVPIIVAINKIDKVNAAPDRVKQMLADQDLLAEDWGGQTVTVPISALKRTGLEQLLEMILLVADLLDLKASPESMARGVVLEAKKDPGRGTVATVLIQDGTLRVGDVFIAGMTIGRVRAMLNDRGERIKETGPASAVEVAGLSDLPNAGDIFSVVEDETKARQVASFRAAKQRDLAMIASSKMSLDQLYSKISKGEAKELRVVLKADVQGSLEVLTDTLNKLSTEAVKIRVLHSGIGAVNVNDVLLASASEAIIIGFSVRPEKMAADLAEKEDIDIRLHTVIYNLTDELRKAMTGLLDPTFKEVTQGRAEIRNTFNVPKSGVVAGCMVLDGLIPRSGQARLLRDNRVIHEGRIASLRRFKDDVSEVRSGFECGISLEKFQDYKLGDVIEAYAMEREPAKLA